MAATENHFTLIRQVDGTKLGTFRYFSDATREAAMLSDDGSRDDVYCATTIFIYDNLNEQVVGVAINKKVFS